MEVQQLAPIELSIPIDESAVAASSTLTSNGTQSTNGKKVTIAGRAYTFKTALTGAVDEVLIGADATATLENLVALINSGRAAVAASGVLTSDESNPTALDELVVASQTYVFVTNLSEAYATATLTASGQPTAGQQVVIGDVTYEFVTSLTVTKRHGQSEPLQIPNRILIGADYDTTLGNLVAAVNGDAGEGTKYSYGTVANPKVSAGAVGSHASLMTARTMGVVGNDIAKSENSANLDWDGAGATFTGGVDSVANEIKLWGTVAGTVQNIVDAINGAAGSKGSGYSTATVANPEMTAELTSTYVVTVTAKTAGTAGNAYAKTESSTHLDWDGAGAVMTGGVDASSVNASVSAGAVSNLATVITAKTAGFAGNSITTTTDETTLSWTGSVLAGGGYTVGTSEEIGQAGRIGVIVVDAPQLTGTPTYTVKIVDASGDQLYVSGNQNENAVTRTVVEQSISATDKIVITTSTVVESSLPFKVNLR